MVRGLLARGFPVCNRDRFMDIADAVLEELEEEYELVRKPR